MAFMGKVSPRLGIEFILERLRAPVDGDVDPFGLGAGTFYVTPLSVNMQYRWPEIRRFIPYAMLGVGFHFAHFLPEEGHEEVADRLAHIFGRGADTRIGRNTSLHLGLKFPPVPTWVQEKGSQPEPDEQEKLWLNPVILTVGIKYFFD
jgi:outer membrane protein W